MKILFLDVDGVLNNHRTHYDHKAFFPIDPYMALLVDRIKEATGCKIVLSSSWRHNEESVEVVKSKVGELFGLTPRYASSSKYKIAESELCRGHNIQDWLDEHPEVTRYAILDDSADMLDTQQPNFFKTSFQIGLTDEIAKKVIEHLNAV